jgi:hypothetical protein
MSETEEQEFRQQVTLKLEDEGITTFSFPALTKELEKAFSVVSSDDDAAENTKRQVTLLASVQQVDYLPRHGASACRPQMASSATIAMPTSYSVQRKEGSAYSCYLLFGEEQGCRNVSDLETCSIAARKHQGANMRRLRRLPAAVPK